MSVHYRIFKYEDKELKMFVYTGAEGDIFYDSRELSTFLGYTTFPDCIKTTPWPETSVPDVWDFIARWPFMQKPGLTYLMEHSTVPWLKEFKQWFEDDDVSSHVKCNLDRPKRNYYEYCKSPLLMINK